MQSKNPGIVVLLGSGETLPSSGKIHEYVAGRLPPNPQIAILETPAGFEPNSAIVADKIKQFLDRRLQNYSPEIEVIAARKRGTPFSPDTPEIVEPILKADEILLGPGSPTYCVRQLQHSLALQMIAVRQRRGGTLFLSSSATLAFSRFTLPVYEIYKVGEDLHWKGGLNFFGQYGLSLVIIPHWNNQDGGQELDTSRCYMGRARFEKLLLKLPPDQTILGIDEHTAVIMDFRTGNCKVKGQNTITILRDGKHQIIETGNHFPLDELGKWYIPDEDAGVELAVWEKARRAEKEKEARLSERREPPRLVKTLAARREQARANKDWEDADRLREKINDHGWEIRDTPSGSELAPLK